MVEILGICGSPVKNSNTELMMREALKSVDQKDVSTDIFSVQGKRIEGVCDKNMGKSLTKPISRRII